MIPAWFLLALLVAAWLPAPAGARPTAARPTAARPTAAPLARPVWLCRPGMVDNPCNQNLRGQPQVEAPGAEFSVRYPIGSLRRTLDTTTVTASGARGRTGFVPPSAPAVDCFYVYPTVDVLPNPLPWLGSLPPSASNTQMAVLIAQIGRLANRCRIFAPVYRQATLLDLIAARLAGVEPDRDLGIADAVQAWDEYWQHDNRDPVTGKRRGVIVLGHSQGSTVAAEVIRRRIDGRPAQRNLVSALLLGGNFQVPDGRLAGGGHDPDATFQRVPVCRRASARAAMPTGCVLGYSAFKLPPGTTLPTDAALGRITVPGHHVLCVNPVALLKGGNPTARTALDTYLPTRRLVGGGVLAPNGFLSAVMRGYRLPTDPTGFTRYPGSRITGGCMSGRDADGSADWLQIDGGDAQIGAPNAGLGGLHALDYNLALGDLVRVVDAQVRAWRSRR